MSIQPYKKPPKPSPVALMVTAAGKVIGEAGETWKVTDTPKGVKVYADRALGVAAASRGVGELVLWNDLPIRWEWGNERGESVYLSGLGFGADPRFLDGLVAWRDWLHAHHATASSVGGAGWSLLRGTLERPLGLDLGDPPPLRDVIGGRQDGIGPGRYGAFEAWDIRAAYPRALGECVYPRGWVRATGRLATDLSKELTPGATPCFVRAEVRLPSIRRSTDRRKGGGTFTPSSGSVAPAIGVPLPLFGPLPKRKAYRPRPDAARKLAQGRSYPRTGTLRGIWCLEELRMAEAVGARVKVEELWFMAGEERHPFLPWYSAVEEGRERFSTKPHANAWAHMLVKATANATVGRLSLTDGERSRVRYVDGERISRKDHAPAPPAFLQAPALYETVTGRIRARIYTELEMAHNERLISVHTDGGLIAWTPSGPSLRPPILTATSELPSPPQRPTTPSKPSPTSAATTIGSRISSESDWRKKDRGVQLWYVGPQCYAYRRPGRGGIVYKVSGFGPEDAARAFYESCAVVQIGRERPLRSVTAMQRLFRRLMARYPSLTPEEALADVSGFLADAPSAEAIRELEEVLTA